MACRSYFLEDLDILVYSLFWDFSVAIAKQVPVVSTDATIWRHAAREEGCQVAHASLPSLRSELSGLPGAASLGFAVSAPAPERSIDPCDRSACYMRSSDRASGQYTG